MTWALGGLAGFATGLLIGIHGRLATIAASAPYVVSELRQIRVALERGGR